MKITQICLAFGLLAVVSFNLFGCYNNSSPTKPNGTFGGNDKERTQIDAPPFEGSWKLITLNGQPVTLERSITIRFDNGQLGGFSGCNTYGGSYEYYAFGNDGSRIYVSNLNMTEMACLDQEIMYLEASFLRVLQAPLADEYSEKQLTLRSEHGQLTFVRYDEERPADSSGGGDALDMPVSNR